MQNRRLAILIAAVSIAAVACGGGGAAGTTTVVTGGSTNLQTFRATMNGPSEVPATTSAGTGTFVATLDTVTNVFTYDVTFTGLTSAAILAHIHGPATTAQSGNALVDLTSLPGATFDLGATAGKGHGSLVLNAANAITAGLHGDSLRTLLFAGLAYVNIHTANNAGGEIRGQITE